MTPRPDRFQRCAGVMRYQALACDYDGTLAHDGCVDAKIVAMLERFLTTGRKLILVTGRELEPLREDFPAVRLFHCVVAENGALLYDPASGQETALASPIAEEFARALRQRGVSPFSAGRVIVSTHRSQEEATLAAIHDLELELQTIYNRDAVMVLPAGVNKAAGLAAALRSMGMSPQDVVGVGDAENDLAFLSLCAFAAAVANALPSVKSHADWVTPGEDSAGVGQLIEELIANDLELREANAVRRRGALGRSRR